MVEGGDLSGRHDVNSGDSARTVPERRHLTRTGYMDHGPCTEPYSGPRSASERMRTCSQLRCLDPQKLDVVAAL